MECMFFCMQALSIQLEDGGSIPPFPSAMPTISDGFLISATTISFFSPIMPPAT
ncbi:hypothetical protein [Paenibacillus sp. TAF43_2]|uniref:hypothetical protein n=1 Tax=Paenibacillus sp. TAF43_2 TaxID=3233069 RepID=UPI003F97EF07